MLKLFFFLALEEDHKIEEVNEAIGQQQALLDSANDVLIKQSDLHQQAQDCSRADELELETFDIAGLKNMLQETEQEKVSKEKELDELSLEIEQVGVTISDLNRKKAETEEVFKTLQTDTIEQKHNNTVLNKRVEGEIKIAQHILKTKINENADRVEKANFSLVSELRNLMDQETENNKLIEEIALELDNNKVKCQELEDLMFEKSLLLEQLDVELNKPPADHNELQEQKAELVKDIEEAERKTSEIMDDIEKTKKSYEKKIRQEKARQTAIDDVGDDDKASTKSSDLESVHSKLSSSIDDIEKAERVSDSSLNMSNDKKSNNN